VPALDRVAGVAFALALVIVVFVVVVEDEPELPQAASPRAISRRTVRTAAAFRAPAGLRLVLSIGCMRLSIHGDCV
jgi:hypothetical protein